jgi:hypothetical protein
MALVYKEKITMRLYIILLFFTAVIVCKNDKKKLGVKNAKSTSNFYIRSFPEFDTIYLGECSMFHVLVKNNTRKKITVLAPENELTFTPHEGLRHNEFNVRTYDGPSSYEVAPGGEKDCGYTGLSGFFENIPLGKSNLKFSLKFYTKQHKHPFLFSDSLSVFVMPARLTFHSTFKEEIKDGKKQKLIDISLKNISNAPIVLGDDNMYINFYEVPEGCKLRELTLEDYDSPSRYILMPGQTYHRIYELDYYFTQLAKGKNNLKFSFSYCIIRGERKDRESYSDTVVLEN